MEKYTGNENNAKVGYSESENINFWERNHVLPRDCETAKLVNDYVESICVNLFKQKGGEYSQPDFFKKNFDIIVSDSDELNAFHLRKTYTKDGKAILCVNKGLFKNVDNEAQLAFVLAHELGHYTVEETREDDKYGVHVSGHEHEVQADRLGFNSMIEGGYNPEEAEAFFHKIDYMEPDTVSAYKSANNSHGSTSTRIANIKDYKSDFERKGVVMPTYTGKDRFDDFVKKFEAVESNDRYISYLEERIRQEHNVASSSELSPQQRRDFCEKIITDEPDVLNTGQRGGEFARILCGNTKSLSKEDAVQINRILEKCYKLDTKNESLYEACVLKLPPRDENGNLWLEPRGSVKERMQFLEQLMTDEKKWEELKNPYHADNVFSKIRAPHPLHDYVEMPKFSLENPQKGDTVPWAGLAASLNVKNKNDMQLIMSVLGVHADYFEQKYGNNGGYITNEKDKMYCDAKGVIISTDPQEVAQLYQQCEETVRSLPIEEQKRLMVLDFHDQLVVMSQNEHGSPEFEQAKQRASEIYIQSKDAFVELDNSRDILGTHRGVAIHLNTEDLDRPTGQLFAEEINEHSPAYIQFYNNEKYLRTFSALYTEVIVDTELKIREQTHPSDYHTRDDCVKNAMEFVASKNRDLYNDFSSSGDFSAEQRKTVRKDVIRDMAPVIFNTYDKLFEDSPGEESAALMHAFVTQTLMNDNVGADGNLAYAEEFRKNRGLKDAQNNADLLDNLKQMAPKEEQRGYIGNTITYTKMMYDYEVMRTINNGADIDIPQVLPYIPGNVSPALADKMTQYVVKHDMFAAREGETAEQTYDRCKELYIKMAEKSAFSSQDDTQYKIEKQLLSHLQKLPPERQAREVYQLLNTQADHALADSQIDNSFLSEQSDYEKATIMKERLKEMGGSILRYDNNKIIAENMYADYVINKFGPDDKSAEYRENMNFALDELSENVAITSRSRICSRIAKGIMAQEELAYDIKEIAGKSVENNKVREEAIRSFNVINTFLQRNPEYSTMAMDFLISNGSVADCKKFSEQIIRGVQENRKHLPEEWEKSINNKLSDNGVTAFNARDIRNVPLPPDLLTEQLAGLHQSYTNADFKTRAVIMHRMLDHAVERIPEEKKLETQISYVSDKIFGNRKEDAELLQEVKKIATAVCHQEEQPTLLLGGVLAGREPGQADENMNVGDGLTMFCEKQGTAWVKLAQTLSYVDQLPQDIRDSLGRLKDKANEPEQWEIWTDLREAMPDKEFNRIKKVKKFIGGGSFNKTILVEMEDEKNGGSKDVVIQVMHDRAATKSANEFRKINGATTELCGVDKKYEILKSIVDRSAKNAKIEVDINEGAKQYVNACNNYGAIENVEVNGVSYVPHVATWERYGDSKFSNYKIMEMAPGKSIDSPDFTPQQKHDMALAYTMIEMTNLMSGKAWDIDRHSKQQNFHITQDKDGKPVVEIGIFDTGAQRAAPTKDEKKLLGRFLIAVVKEQQKGKDSNLSEFMLEKIKKFEKAGKDVNYVSDVQRGLLAISDVMKHMNTPENPNGMAEGLKTCFAALHKNKLIDNKLYKTLIKETVKAALTNPKFGKSVAEALLQPTESKDNITVNLSKDNTKAQQQIKASVRSDKPEHETEAIELEKTRIRPKPKTPKEQVEKILADVAMPKETYLLLTPEDSWLKTTYLDTGRSIEGYFNAQEEAKQEGAKILMGTNNGYTALYFAEQNIYVVSPGYELANKMYYKAGCKNVGYGVMFSNGEKFTNAEFMQDKWENKKTAMKEWRDSGYDKTVLEKYSKGFSKAAFQEAAPAHQLTAAVCKKEDIAFEKISFESLSKSSDMIMLQDYDLSDKNLLAVKNVCCKNCKISAKTELPDYAVLENVSIPKGMDLSRMEKVAFINCEIGDGVKLPPITHIKDCTVPENIDTSKCLKELKCINCKMDENIALPQGAKLVINEAEKEHPLIIEGMTKKAPEPAKQAEPKVEVKTPEPVKQAETKVEVKTPEPAKQAEEKKKTSKPKSAGKTITALRGLGKKTLKEVRKTSLDRSKIKDKSNTK